MFRMTNYFGLTSTAIPVSRDKLKLQCWLCCRPRTFTEISTSSSREGEGKKKNQITACISLTLCLFSRNKACPLGTGVIPTGVFLSYAHNSTSDKHWLVSTSMWMHSKMLALFLLQILFTPTFWNHEYCLQLKLIQQLKDQNIYMCLETNVFSEKKK